jgi:hypothetical protein
MVPAKGAEIQFGICGLGCTPCLAAMTSLMSAAIRCRKVGANAAPGNGEERERA